MNTINSHYFSFAPLFFVLSPSQRLTLRPLSAPLPPSLPSFLPSHLRCIPRSGIPSFHLFRPFSVLIPHILSSFYFFLFFPYIPFILMCLETTLLPDFSLAGCFSRCLPVSTLLSLHTETNELCVYLRGICVCVVRDPDVDFQQLCQCINSSTLYIRKVINNNDCMCNVAHKQTHTHSSYPITNNRRTCCL